MQMIEVFCSRQFFSSLHKCSKNMKGSWGGGGREEDVKQLTRLCRHATNPNIQFIKQPEEFSGEKGEGRERGSWL